MKAIYPGTFDPITYGHLDILVRASKIFPKVTLAVAENKNKKPLFPLEKRVELIRKSLPSGLSKIEILPFNNLLIHFAQEHESPVIIRGLRAVSDFEFEFQMALMNKKMAPQIETFFMMPHESFTYLSSRSIKEIAQMGGDISKFVPPVVKEALIQIYRQ